MKTSLRIISFLFIIYLFSGFLGCNSENRYSDSYDIIVYGGTSAGISAAIQASRMDKSVLIIEPSNRLGGLTTGGLGQTDIGNKQAIGGISREFYQNIKKYYEIETNWIWQDSAEYRDGGQTRTNEGEDAMWTFEPSAALKVIQKMIKNENIDILYNQRLNRETGIIKNNDKISSITMESGSTYYAKIFIDATYEGDLMASAGVSYAIGRENNDQYGESVNGVQANDTSLSLLGNVSVNGRNHNFVYGVDPYIEEGKAESGLLPFIDPNGPGVAGEGDARIQAYCFRMCLTDHPENRIPFTKPNSYNELDYELLFRNYASGYEGIPWINSSMPNKKTDTNNKDGFSTDFIGQNYAYPEASYKEREEIIMRHKEFQKGLMWTLANHERIPERIRKEVSRWGTCKDEFENSDGWQQQLYIREARRMISDLVMNQKHCEGIDIVDDPIGMAAYGMDSHNVQRYINEDGFVRNEGNVQTHVKGPYPISYRSIVPKIDECSNLIVPVCLSSTHIAFGSIRMEPVFMVLGQSAAIVAALSIDKKTQVQNVKYSSLNKELIKYDQILE